MDRRLIGYAVAETSQHVGERDPVRIWAMPSFRDLADVTTYLTDLDLPFTWYVMGPDRGTISVEVAPQDHDTALSYFSQHPLTLEDHTPVPVSVVTRRGRSWVSPPDQDVDGPTDAFDAGALVGLDVTEATQLANAAGWLVYAHETEAIITADYNPSRLNLRYGDDEKVLSVGRG
jgi:hypothetical protein